MSELLAAAALGGGIAVFGSFLTHRFALKSQRVAASLERARMKAEAEAEEERARRERVFGERRDAYMAYISYVDVESPPQDLRRLAAFVHDLATRSTPMLLVGDRDTMFPIFDSLEYLGCLCTMRTEQERDVTYDELSLYGAFFNHAISRMRMNLGFASTWGTKDPDETLRRLREEAYVVLGGVAIGTERPLGERRDS